MLAGEETEERKEEYGTAWGWVLHTGSLGLEKERVGSSQYRNNLAQVKRSPPWETAHGNTMPTQCLFCLMSPDVSTNRNC